MNALWPLWATALTLLLLTLGGLLWPLLRESADQPATAADAHERLRSIYRAQRAELEREHQRQAISAEDYAQAVEELERRLLTDIDGAALPPAAAPEGAWRRRIPAGVLSILLPLGALALYIEVGDPRAAATVALGTPDTHASAGVDVEAMVAKLKERLQQKPDDLEGWRSSMLPPLLTSMR
jgi:cytochrome c-type biogenesis protein CcmH